MSNAGSRDGIVSDDNSINYDGKVADDGERVQSRKVSGSASEAGRRSFSGTRRYFIGPRELDQHSKWPMFLRLEGSIVPDMILPLLFVGVWSTLITCISKYIHDLGIDNLLLTVLGLVVGLALSFRSATAHTRYYEGRTHWAELTQASQKFARLVWIHADERHSDPTLGKQDLLAKISCLNLISAYAVALKHRLRFEPYMHYDDLKHLISHLDVYAKAVDLADPPKKRNVFKTAGQFLGVPMAEGNPRRTMKQARGPLGNIPLEILNHLSSYTRHLWDSGTFKVPTYMIQALRQIGAMNDALTNTDLVLTTPLPIAYSIAISQVTWVYILVLPFQLIRKFGWVTIPASVFAAYVILGIALIGRQIENPFGDDVNNLPLDAFCEQIRKDIDVIMARPAPCFLKVAAHEDNKVLYPLSNLGAKAWAEKSVKEIHEALASKPGLHFYNSHGSATKSRHASGHHKTEAHRAEEGVAGMEAGSNVQQMSGPFRRLRARLVEKSKSGVTDASSVDINDGGATVGVDDGGDSDGDI